MKMRRERLSELFRQEISSMLLAGKVKDPRLVGFITIVRVEMNRDLTLAKVYASIMGSEKEQATTFAGLRSSAGMIRSEIGSQIRLKILPEIRFIQDRSVAYSARIDSLLADVPPSSGEGS
jgi:ribosome-binding factor A